MLRHLHVFVPTLSIVTTLLIAEIFSLRLTNIHVPHKTSVGYTYWLNCSYDLERNQLYSIKWYKDDDEIYRFLPSSNPSKAKYDVLGLNIDLELNSSHFIVIIDCPESRNKQTASRNFLQIVRAMANDGLELDRKHALIVLAALVLIMLVSFVSIFSLIGRSVARRDPRVHFSTGSPSSDAIAETTTVATTFEQIDGQPQVIELEDGMLVQVKPVGFNRKSKSNDFGDKENYDGNNNGPKSISDARQLQGRFEKLKANIMAEIEQLSLMASQLREGSERKSSKSVGKMLTEQGANDKDKMAPLPDSEPEKVIQVQHSDYVSPEEFQDILRRFGVEDFHKINN
ncbi:hypothetical protein HDE_12449 [Halotydeus destructor]|nr:hypothetical protein HDE_12449 [Halotydeus destructor]